MALTPQNNEAFLREVDDELRRDQALAFWRRWGRWLVIGTVVALVALAGFLFWRHYRASVAEDQGVMLQTAFDALSAGKPQDAGKALAPLAASQIGGYRALARFTEADILLDKKDLKGAAAKFASVAADTGVGQPLRDLATIRQTTSEFDSLKPEVVIDRLRGLAKPGSPWFGSAGEMVAAAYLRQRRADLAGPLYAKMAQDDDVPATIRQRAVQMASVLGVDAVGAVPGKAGQ